jgi:hypothetical protein
MLKFLALAGFALLSTVTVAIAGETVDLDRPGALESLQQSRPAHYSKVKVILDGVARQRDADVGRWMRVGFDAHDVSYAPIVLTSHPAKRRLSFALDDTRYVAVIVMTHARGDIVLLR